MLRFDFLSLILYDPDLRAMRLQILASTEAPESQPSYEPNAVEESPAGWVWQHQVPLVLPNLDEESPCSAKRRVEAPAMLYGMVQRQAAMLAFIDVFWILAATFPSLIPLIFVMKSVRPASGEHTIAE